VEHYIYTAMSGAQHMLVAQQIRANNLANVNTNGFRADFERAGSYAVSGPGYRTRFLSQEENAGTSFAAGALMQTGRKLDVAIRGEGLLTVQGANGEEAYTRAGNLQVEADGRLTLNGRSVLGEGGEEITLPEYSDLDIGQDGTVSVAPPGGGALLEVGRIKLVKPDTAGLQKGLDGLIHRRVGGAADTDDSVELASGFLEGSNVNAVDELINTLSLTRTFELQVRLMRTADEQARSGAKLISGTN
jgi:flagellar basal-body rod protein FlgF